MKRLLELAKKNVVSLICAIIALLAIGAVFWPITGKFDDLNTEVNNRKSDFSALDSLLKKGRTLPQTDPNEAEAQPLDVFPTRDVIAKGKSVTEDVASQSKAMKDKADEMNVHAPLLAGVFPDVRRLSAGKFQAEYQKAMDFANADPAVRNSTLPGKVLRGGVLPSDKEINDEKMRVKDDIEQRKLFRDPQGKPLNQPQVDQEVLATLATLADRMRMEVARNSQIYVDSDAIDIYPGMMGTAAGQP
ncbi:MAG: hypothetical protein ACREJC_01185, partial [Tepidisphaeraceae bacterium]